MSDTLRVSDIIVLGDILSAAQHNHSVIRIKDDCDFRGVARQISTSEGFTGPTDTDVRDLFLRVTLNSGTDVYWPIRELMADTVSGHLALNYPPRADVA